MSTMFDTITFSSLVTFKCMLVCPTHLLPRAPVPTYVELPHLGRLPVRVLVRDARRGGAQGPHAEGSVNIGRGGHRDS